jgi:transposase
MTIGEPIPNNAVLVAVDIAKSRNEVLIEVDPNQRRRRLTVLNTRTEHDRFIATLAGYNRAVVCAFEATGNYHRPLAWRLIKAGYEARLVSSVGLAGTREALHNGWNKNDPRDAQVILHMLRIGATQRYYDPLAVGINDVQELSKTHEAISKAKTEIQHRILTHYLRLYFPGRSLPRLQPQRLVLRLPRSLSDPGVRDRAVEGRVYQSGVERHRTEGQQGTPASRYIRDGAFVDRPPLPFDAPAIEMFRMVLAEARSLIRQRHTIEDMAESLLKDSADYQSLRRIPGVGPITAMTVIAEAGDLRRFGHHRQLLKFCGLDLAAIQSGTFRGQTKLSKYGNARLRKALWLAGQVAIRQRDNSFRDKFDRYIARDRDNPDLRRKALTAITAKMARVVHAVVKSGSDYRPFFEGPAPGGRTSLSKGREGARATL